MTWLPIVLGALGYLGLSVVAAALLFRNEPVSGSDPVSSCMAGGLSGLLWPILAAGGVVLGTLWLIGRVVHLASGGAIATPGQQEEDW